MEKNNSNLNQWLEKVRAINILATHRGVCFFREDLAHKTTYVRVMR